MSERRCPKCGAVYPATARFCPRDGNMLVEAQSKAPLATPSGGGATAVRTPPGPRRGPGLDRAATLSGQTLDARYQVTKKLGEGGMSYVYLAREVASGDEVAIKVLSPKLATDRSSVERLRREAGLAMRLDHANVCRILRLGESEDGLIYLVMPFLNGELLSDREVRGGPMELTQGIARLRDRPRQLRHLRPDLPANLEKALARALESSPDARYRTALEFADALTATHEGGLFSRIKEKLK